MQVFNRIEPDRIRDLLRRDEFFWLDLVGVSGADVDAVAELLDLPTFAVEDSKELGQRPKLDDYGPKILLVFYGADQRDQLVEVHLHLSGQYVVTMHATACGELDRPREAVARHEIRSELDLVFRILDALADSLSAKVERIGARVDEIEDAAFEHPDAGVRRDIAVLRAELFRFGQIVRPQAELLADDGEVLEHLPGLEGERARHPFREVHDVLVISASRIEALREQLAEALGIYLSSTSNRLNALATRLAVLGTIFLPLTFITGFFGQNFGWLVSHIQGRHAFLVWTIVPTVVVLASAALLGGLLTIRRR